MSFDYNLFFGPATPPEYSFDLAFQDATWESNHSRTVSTSSQASFYSQDSSPESVNTQLTTPAKSPIRQHGPLLLPKIRSQDQEILESPPKRVRKAATATNPSNWRPGHARSYTNPENVSFSAPTLSIPPSHSRSSSSLCSPISMNNEQQVQRRSSSCSLDGQTLGKYGFPTYRQLPTYIQSSTNPNTETFVPHHQPYFMPTPREPSPMRNEVTFADLVSDDDFNDLTPIADPSEPTTTLTNYLTSPNPAPSLVRQLNIHIRDNTAKHFWWDIRQIRPWTSFNSATICAIPGLHQLLTIALSPTALPIPPAPRTNAMHPETEAELHSLYASYYSTKLNAALALAQGQRHLVMRPCPTGSQPGVQQPHFLSNYIDDTSELIYGTGRGLGRVVGLVKSFDRWNSGMRVEGNHKKVEYLRGIAHLHRYMREHGCRYGFILTEIELFVVRNGSEAVPHFGYVEVCSIPLAACEREPELDYVNAGLTPPSSASVDNITADIDPSDLSLNTPEPQPPKEPKLTALLGLFYLHLLARDVPLPGTGQVSWKTEIGAPAEGTRRKCLPKDEWMPEPQLAEKREAKRIRGWVWPEESVGRKELGRRGVRYSGF